MSYYRVLQKRGLCYDCRAPVEQGKGRCRACIRQHSLRQTEQRRQRRLEGRCTKCRGGLDKEGVRRCASCRAKDRAYHSLRRRRIRKIVLEAYGGKCACCAEEEPAFLVLDHVNGDGAEHRKHLASGLWAWAYRNGCPDRLQLLCWNCNCFVLSALDLPACPHQLQA